MPNGRLKRSGDTHCGKYTIGAGGPPALPKPTRYVNKEMKNIVCARRSRLTAFLRFQSGLRTPKIDLPLLYRTSNSLIRATMMILNMGKNPTKRV